MINARRSSEAFSFIIGTDLLFQDRSSGEHDAARIVRICSEMLPLHQLTR